MTDTDLDPCRMTRRQWMATSGAMSVLSATSAAFAQERVEESAAPVPARPVRLQIALFEGFELVDALAPFDAWKIAGIVGAPIQASLFSMDGAEEVTALHGIVVKPDAVFDPDADVLVVPGAPAVWRAGITPAGLPALMQEWIAAGKQLATVCTGAVFAARQGLLQGRNAVSHQNARSILEEQGAIWQNACVVDDGDILRSAGNLSGVDLALYVIERYAGAPSAIQVETVIEYVRRGTVWQSP